MVGNLNFARGEPQRFSATAPMNVSAATPWRVAMANASASACTVHAEIKLVASFTTVAEPIPPQASNSLPVRRKKGVICLTNSSSPPV